MKNYFLFVFFSVLFSFHTFAQGSRGANPETSGGEVSGKIKAVIVGVSVYKNLENDLLYAHRDALTMYTFLKSMPNADTENMHLFLNQEARKDTVETTIYQVLKTSAEGDIVVFYFAGHGNVDAYIDEGYLLLYNVSKDGDYEISDAFPLTQLQKLTARAVRNGVKVILITDACRSGKLVGEPEGAKKTLSVLIEKWDNTLKFVSCEPEQSSFENKKWGDGHGVFTYYFLKGMIGESDKIANKNNIVEAGELHDYILDNVKKETEYKQIPKFEGKYLSPLFQLADGQSEKLSSYLGADDDELFAYSNIERGDNETVYQLEPEVEELLAKFKRSVVEKNLIPTEEEEKRVEEGSISVKSEDFSKVSHENEYSVDVNKYEQNVFATGNSDKYVRIWNSESFTKSSKPDKTLGPHNSGVFSVKFSSDGKYLISADWSAHLYLWDWRTGNLICKFRPHNAGIASFNVTRNGNILSSSGKDKTLKIFNIDSLAKSNFDPLNTIQFKGMYLDCQAFSKNAEYIFGASGNKVIKVKASGKGDVTVLKGHRSSVVSCAVSPDGNLLCTGDKSGKVILRNLITGGTVGMFDVRSSVNALEFDNSNSWLFISGMARKTHIVDLETMKMIDLKISSPQSVTGMAFSSENKKLYMTTYAWESNRSSTGVIDLDIPEYIPEHAFGIYQKILASGQHEQFTDRLRNNLYIALNETSQKYIDPFIEGKDVKPSVKEVHNAIRMLKYAYDLYADEPLLNEKVIAKKLFLEVNEIMLKNDLDKIDEAVLMCDSILKLDPYATYPHNTMAELYKKLNDFTKSKESVNNAIDQMPVWTEPKANIGKTLMAEGNFQKAEEEFKKIVKLQPNISKGYTNLGIIYTLNGNYDDAEQNFKTALEKDDQNPFIYVKYSELELKRKRYEHADELLKEAIKISDDYYLPFLKSGELYMLKGDYKNAGKCFMKASEADSSVAEIFLKINELELKRGRIKTAEEILMKAIAKDPNSYQVYVSAGNHYLHVYKYIQRKDEYLEKCIEYYEKALKLGKYEPDAYTAFADFYVEAFITEDANDFFIKYFDLNVSQKSSGKHLVKSTVNKQARELLNDALKLNPEFMPADLIMLKTQIMMNSKSIDNKFKEIRNKYPDASEINYLYAEYIMNTGDEKEALKVLSEITQNDPYYFPAYYAELDFYQNSGKRKLKKYIEELTQRFDYSPLFWHEKAVRQRYGTSGRSDLSQAKAVDNDFYLSKLALHNFYFLISNRKTELTSYKDTEIGIDRVDRIKPEYIIVKKGDKYGMMHVSGKFIYTLDYDSYKILSDKVIFKKGGESFDFVFKHPEKKKRFEK